MYTSDFRQFFQVKRLFFSAVTFKYLNLAVIARKMRNTSVIGKNSFKPSLAQEKKNHRNTGIKSGKSAINSSAFLVLKWLIFHL